MEQLPVESQGRPQGLRLPPEGLLPTHWVAEARTWGKFQITGAQSWVLESGCVAQDASWCQLTRVGGASS